MRPFKPVIWSVAMLALAGCAPTAPYGQPVQPATVLYDGGYGYNAGPAHPYGAPRFGYGYRDDPIFHPARNLTCDRARDLCYDRFGLDYFATARYFGDRAANRSARKFGEQVFLFSPKRGVTCDRRSRSCSDAGGLDLDLTERYFGKRAEHRVGDWLESAMFKPEPHVTCSTATKVCSDRKGPSITLTQIYFGRAAAQDLADELGPGAPGYMRVPGQPTSRGAPAVPAEGTLEEPLAATTSGTPPPLPPVADAPVAVDEGEVPLSGLTIEPAQPEQPLPAPMTDLPMAEPPMADLPMAEPPIAEPPLFQPMVPQGVPPLPEPDLESAPSLASPAAAEAPPPDVCADPQACPAE